MSVTFGDLFSTFIEFSRKKQPKWTKWHTTPLVPVAIPYSLLFKIKDIMYAVRIRPPR